MIIAALFTVAKTWKQPTCPLTDEWIKKHLSMQQKQTHRHREEIFGCQGGGEWEREGLELGISKSKLVNIG